MQTELTKHQRAVAKRVREYLGPSKAVDAATDEDLLAESEGKAFRAFIELGVAGRAFLASIFHWKRT